MRRSEMKARQVYYKLYSTSELPYAIAYYATRNSSGILELFNSVPLRFSEGHEYNINKMEEIEKISEFEFWNNSGEGEEFFRKNKDMISRALLNIFSAGTNNY
jgi:hypothetical protein